MSNIPPELDFTSEHFDPVKALAAKNIYLPYPNAKTYNNLADWYSHTFKKNVLSSQSKAASKDVCFVLKRNYGWYYETLGLDLPDDFDVETHYRKYTKRKRNNNGKYMIDKKVKVMEMPPEMLTPLRSSKILVKRSDGSLKNYIVFNAGNKNSDNENLSDSNAKPSADMLNDKNVIKHNAVGMSKELSSANNSKASDTCDSNQCTKGTTSENEVQYPCVNNIHNDDCQSMLVKPLMAQNKELLLNINYNIQKEVYKDVTTSSSAASMKSVDNKENSKEQVLLELARKARQRLHVQ